METRKYDLSDYVMSMFRREKMGRTVIYFNIYVHVYLLQFLELRVSFNYLNHKSGSDFTKKTFFCEIGACKRKRKGIF